MKCPNCGAEIPEGHLLCDVCGQEIRIVPDFEPEVENSITETLSVVAENLTEEPAEQPEDEHEKQKNMFVLSLGCVFVLALIILTAYFSVTIYHKSVGYQTKAALAGIENGDYETALFHLQNALNAGGDFEEIKWQMVSCYEAMGEEEKYLKGLLELVRNEQASADTVQQGYAKIIAYYEKGKQYEQINTLLQNCGDDSVRKKYIKYMANMPEFNYLEGSYNEVIPLKILSSSSGHIYYTMDGTNPDIYSEEYSSPIFLETGDYEITAVFVNEFGIKSPYAKAVYHVDVSIPFAPEIDSYSGDFYTPQLIHAIAEEGCEIYYTTDGSEPDALSRQYTGLLSMPLGDSTFKFVAIDENGVSSEVTVRNYHLELLTDYTTDDANAVIMKYLAGAGKIIDLNGTISEEDPRRMVYSFAGCYNIKEEGDFYVFSEYIESPDGSREKTGNYYAVGVYSLPLYGTEYSTKTGTFALSTELLLQGP